MSVLFKMKQSIAALLCWILGRRTKSHLRLRGGSSRALVGQRPFHLPDHFESVSSGEVLEDFFLRFRDEVYESIDTFSQRSPLEQPKVIRESGRLPEGRRYFFLQPLNHRGWLFEQTDYGWQVAQAQKIASDQTFLRSYDVFDRVTLSQPVTSSKPTSVGGESSLIRVSSQRFHSEYVSLSVYERQLQSLWVVGQHDSPSSEQRA